MLQVAAGASCSAPCGWVKSFGRSRELSVHSLAPPRFKSPLSETERPLPGGLLVADGIRPWPLKELRSGQQPDLAPSGAHRIWPRRRSLRGPSP